MSVGLSRCRCCSCGAHICTKLSCQHLCCILRASVLTIDGSSVVDCCGVRSERLSWSIRSLHNLPVVCVSLLLRNVLANPSSTTSLPPRSARETSSSRQFPVDSMLASKQMFAPLAQAMRARPASRIVQQTRGIKFQASPKRMSPIPVCPEDRRANRNANQCSQREEHSGMHLSGGSLVSLSG